ncbi:O-acetylhomoserine aminocarboxypropyltransferase/cysteine synthase family protein [Anaerolentibacter hominis]|uniref:O-acetylhomoserine aminocarboxypropyltransferase/cysteine synthase family protein n=1 Tax=Anaerolentibacter hominis TaxID=3079009 RepID=UPI0031B7F875
MELNNWHIETKCIQEGYQPKDGEPRVLPIYQSTTFKYDSSETVGKLFDLEENGFFYTRLANPTVDCVERKIAALEGGVGAMCTSSGQAASLITILNLCSEGDHVIASGAIYGGTTNLFTVTLKRLGIEVTLINADSTEEELEAAVRDNTKCIFAESIANPALIIIDFELYAKVAHRHHIPFIVDNTFATPINFRPLEHGADIVIHSTSKYMDGHAVALGGVIVDGGTFDWNDEKFPGFTQPDESYHGMVYARDCKESAFIVKARVQLMRDLGSAPAANSAFLLNLGLETLHLRMERHCSNALKAAKWLQANEKIDWVEYPGLPGSRYYERAQKYMPNGTCGVIAFGPKGGREAAMKLMDSLKLAAIVVHVADARTSVLHPASTTHRQLSDEQLKEAGVKPELIRMSIGLENIDDIIADLEQAVAQI